LRGSSVIFSPTLSAEESSRARVDAPGIGSDG
jgi:hypothetical protein